MAWSTSDRRQRLPSDWPSIRKRIWRRDQGLCQVKLPGQRGRRCLQPASDVDHIEPGDDHRDENLQCICDWHHTKKSSSEGGLALQAKRRRARNQFRRTEEHPGLL